MPHLLALLSSCCHRYTVLMNDASQVSGADEEGVFVFGHVAPKEQHLFFYSN